MRKESKTKAAVFVAGKMDGGCRKAITVRSKRVMTSNQETRKQYISEQ